MISSDANTRQVKDGWPLVLFFLWLAVVSWVLRIVLYLNEKIHGNLTAACVGLAINLLLIWLVERHWRTWKRRFNFSLKALLVVMTAVAVWLGIYWMPLQERRIAIAKIEQLGGTLDVKYFGPGWLRKLVGDEKYFWDPIGVHFNRPLSAAELDAVWPSVMSFQRLHILSIPGTISDENVERLSPLASKLTFLNITDSSISDASLGHLKEYRQLIQLCAFDTNLTPVGIAELHHALPECTIGTFVDDKVVNIGP